MANPADVAAIGISPEEIENELSHWNDDRAPLVIIVTTFFTACAMIATVARLVTRRTIVKIPWQLDDYAIAIATFFAIGLYIEALLIVHFGTGKHLVRVGLDGTVKMQIGTYALEITYSLCHLAIKASLLFLYKTVLTLENRKFRIAWYAVALYVLALYSSSVLATVFQCTPIHYGWDRLYANVEGHCVHLKTEAISTAILSALSDVSLLVLPIPILWGLQMPLKRKLALLSIFLLGGFACVASIVRIVFLVTVQDDIDVTYHEVDPLNWSIIEPCVGIICACLSTLRPLFRLLFHKASTWAPSKNQGSSWFSLRNRRGTRHPRNKLNSSKSESPIDRPWGLHNKQQRLGSGDGQMGGTYSPGLAFEMGGTGGREADEEASGHHISHVR